MPRKLLKTTSLRPSKCREKKRVYRVLKLGRISDWILCPCGLPKYQSDVSQTIRMVMVTMTMTMRMKVKMMMMMMVMVVMTMTTTTVMTMMSSTFHFIQLPHEQCLLRTKWGSDWIGNQALPQFQQVLVVFFIYRPPFFWIKWHWTARLNAERIFKRKYSWLNHISFVKTRLIYFLFIQRNLVFDVLITASSW